MKKVLGLFTLSFILAFGLAFAQSGGGSGGVSGGGAGGASGGVSGGQVTIADLLSANPQFSTLVGALKDAGLYLTLQEGGPYTVFAPTNDAFDKLPPGQLTALMDDPTQLTALLKYHIAVGQHLTAPLTLATLEGSALTITQTGMGGITVSMSGGAMSGGMAMSGGIMSGGMMSGGSRAGFMINDASMSGPIITASNGLIYPIDEVLVPPALNLNELGTPGSMSGGGGVSGGQ